MNSGKFFPLVVVALSIYHTAAASNAAPAAANAPIYYGRPNNGGYPYPATTPEAVKPGENKTEAPTPPSEPIYYGRPNNGGYPYPTSATHDPEGSYSRENATATPAPANVPIYNGRPNNGGYPYTNTQP
ncbi:hypothetical protein L914_00287 [Phytophthora nicotianae]|uniref:RxLR effector protein n=1 Tax=Phytophthora nicotianae TaxID=4792 RepID=W2P7L5_PHYNI|nr:hypothetical protein L914_00287 [Phytophthora nicotianae]